MSWVSVDFTSAAFGTGAGHVTLMNPEGSREELELPDRCFAINQKTSMAAYIYGEKARLFLEGGLSDGCMVTEQRALLRNFITPTERELVLSAAPSNYQIGLEAIPGTGLTGLVNWFIRWRDPIHGRRSPLSGMSPTMNLSGAQAVKFRNLPLRPTPEDYGVSQIEFWANVNGVTDSNGRLVVRRIATRDSGAATVTITETAELEAETEQGLQAPPRGTMNVIYHNRRWWNDPKHPNRVCFSPLDRPDEWGGGYRTTRNGEDVTGLFVVRDTLCIFAGMASYRLNGYTESDFVVSGMDPGLGSITHFGNQLIGQIGVIPTREGLALCTGNSMRLIPSDYQRLWATQYLANRAAFEGGFGINDTVAKVYKFWDGTRYWVFDYSAYGLSADSAPPLLSFDTHQQKPTCAAMLPVPGARTGKFYAGWEGGQITAENQWLGLDAVGDFRVKVVPAMIAAESAGGPWDGLQLNNLWAFLYNLNPDTDTIEVLYGNEFAALGGGSITQNIETVGAILQIPESIQTKLLSLEALPVINPGDPEFFPWTMSWGNLGLKGEGFTVRVVSLNPTKFIFRGHGMTVQPGSKARVQHQVSE